MKAGAGKSALIAECSQNADQVLPAPEVLVRFAGATPESSSLRSFLETLCREINIRYEHEEKRLPSAYEDLCAEFLNRLNVASADHPLIIFVDGLDQISDPEGTNVLSWIPLTLPDNVRLILSALPGELFSVLQQRLPSENVLSLGPLAMDERKEVVETLLRNSGRTLQLEQRAEVQRRLHECGLPLYLHLLYQEIRHWHSYDPIASPCASVEKMFDRLISGLSEPSNHGPMLVSRSLAYLAASRNGLTEEELIDLLSCDDDVFAYFDSHAHHLLVKHEHSQRKLPIVLWSRLYFDLQPYLQERVADNTSLITFHDRQFLEAVERHCLSGDQKVSSPRGGSRLLRATSSLPVRYWKTTSRFAETF